MSIEALKRRADDGDLRAAYEYASRLYNMKRFPEALQYFKRAADAGHTGAQLGCGYILLYQGDYPNAARHFKQAARQHDREGQFNYGHCSEVGRGVPQNIGKANRYYKLAANQGSEAARGRLISNVMDGCVNGLSQADIADCYKFAADRGNADAQRRYAHCLETGTGVSVNRAEAMRYRQLAAGQEPSEDQEMSV